MGCKIYARTSTNNNIRHLFVFSSFEFSLLYTFLIFCTPFLLHKKTSHTPTPWGHEFSVRENKGLPIQVTSWLCQQLALQFTKILLQCLPLLFHTFQRVNKQSVYHQSEIFHLPLCCTENPAWQCHPRSINCISKVNKVDWCNFRAFSICTGKSGRNLSHFWICEQL